MQSSLQVEPIRCLSDNYAWLVTSTKAPHEAVVVDPGEAAPVIRMLETRSLRLSAIVITHHHHDHIGGIDGLLKHIGAQSSAVRVLAGRYDVQRCRVPHATEALADNDKTSLLGVSWQALSTPGHTQGATSYHVAESHLVFTGDTLFLSGCGRLIEGEAQQHFASLNRLRSLPGETDIYCGHEYTRKNLLFALSLFPSDKSLQTEMSRVDAQLRTEKPTVPGLMTIERRTNVFFRCDEQSIAEKVSARPGLETFVALRALRDRF